MASVVSAESNDPVYGGSLQTEAKTEDSQAEHQSCEQCEQEKPVKAFCVECQEYLCEECSIDHCRPTRMRRHMLKKDKDMPRKKATKFVSENCVQHEEEVNKFFCERHNECCCSVCAVTLHKSCEVKALTTITRNYITSEEYDKSKKDLKLVTDLAQEQTEKIEKNIKASKTSVNDALDKLSKHRNDINKHFDELEKELKDEAMIMQTEDVEQMHDLSQSCMTMLKDIEEMMDVLSVLEDTKQEKLLFTAVKTNEKQIEHIKASLEQINIANKVRLVKFCKSRTTNSMTIRKDLLGFLQVLVEEKENEGDKKGDKEEENEEKIKEKVEETDEKGKVGYKGGEKVEDNREEGLMDKGEREQENDMAEGKGNDFDNVTGNQYEYSCQNCKAGKTHFDCKYSEEVLPKGLKVSETAVVILEYHKSKVSLCTVADKNECANIVFSTGPWDMTKVETSILAVTLPHEKKVKFLHVDDRIEEADEITTPGFCKCIASSCNYLVVTFTEPAGLKLLSKSGEVLRDVQMTEAGNTLFSLPSSIVVVDRNIFVTDPLMNTVTRLDSDGKIEEILSHKDLIRPSLIAYSNEKLSVTLYNASSLTMTCDFENTEVDNEINGSLFFHGSVGMIKNTEPWAVCGIFIFDDEEEDEEEEEEDEEEEEEDDDHRKDSFSHRDKVWKSSDVAEYKPRESMWRKKPKKECTVS